MQRQAVIVTAVLAALVAVALLKPEREGAGPAPDAVTPAELAIAEAAAAGRPVLLSFRSNSCLPCQAIGATLAGLRPKYQSRVAFVDVSLDSDTPDSALCERYQVRVKPTTVFLDRDGGVAGVELGALPAELLEARLEGLLQ